MKRLVKILIGLGLYWLFYKALLLLPDTSGLDGSFIVIVMFVLFIVGSTLIMEGLEL